MGALDKPTLHDIAAMPFPASQLAMRKFYNPEWGKHIPDGAVKQTFSVEVAYRVSDSGTRTVEVEAFTKEEAEELASEEVGRDVENEYDVGADIEIESARASIPAGTQ